MSARAELAERTRQRIMEAATQLASERFIDEISLDDVAKRAGVTVRTVIRRFGNRANLLAAAFQHANAQVSGRREETPPNDIADAVDALFDDYEQWGNALVMLLAQEQRHPQLQTFLNHGRHIHRQWVERVFSPPDEVRAAEFQAVTDVYLWKLLRRDMGLPRNQAELAMRDIIERLVE